MRIPRTNDLRIFRHANVPDAHTIANATGQIDLSDSSVSDEVLDQFYKLGWTQYVGLRNTKVTTKGLARVNASTLDIRDTNIEPAGVLNQTIPYGQVFMRHEGFTPEQLLRARRFRIQVDHYGDWPY